MSLVYAIWSLFSILNLCLLSDVRFSAIFLEELFQPCFLSPFLPRLCDPNFRYCCYIPQFPKVLLLYSPYYILSLLFWLDNFFCSMLQFTKFPSFPFYCWSHSLSFVFGFFFLLWVLKFPFSYLCILFHYWAYFLRPSIFSFGSSLFLKAFLSWLV